MLPTERIRIILDKINKGTATPEELAEFNSWYSSFDDTKVTLYQSDSVEKINLSIWQKINQRAFDNSFLRKGWVRGGIAAASVLLVSGLLFFKQYTNSDNNDSNFSLKAASVLSDGQQSAIDMSVDEFLDSTYYYSLSSTKKIEVKTDKASLTKLLLPDGTKVTLNADSRIFIEDGFGDNDTSLRVVRLEGEAYFEVKSNPKRQFIVKTENQLIRVLGTKFNVKVSKNNSEVQTALYEGKILLETPQENIVVLPNQVISNTNSNLKIVDKDIDKTRDWRSLTFSFDQDLVEDVIERLASKYDLEVVKVSSIPKQRISGQWGKDLTVQEIAVVMSNLTGGDFQLKDKKLTINFKNKN